MAPAQDSNQNKTQVTGIARRALKACESCRRQKTRCFPSDDKSHACLRCLSVGRECSFTLDGPPKPSEKALKRRKHLNGGDERQVAVARMSNTMMVPVINGPNGQNAFNTNRLLEIDANVKKLLSLVGGDKVGGDKTGRTYSITHDAPVSLAPLRSSHTEHEAIESPAISVSPSHTSPLQVINSSTPSGTVPLSIAEILAPARPDSLEDEEPPNVLNLGIITLEKCASLVNKFKENYEQWISLPSNLTTEELINDLKSKSPILLTIISLTALRYNVIRTRAKDETSLQKQISIRLGQELKEFLTTPSEFKNLEFLKALTILSVYGYSLSTEELVIDPWFISGVAIQWFISLDINNSFLQISGTETEEETEDKLSNFRVWNHICLVHLANCVFSGRMCLLDEIRLDQARQSLELTQATNFDGRMIGELAIQLLLYNFIQSSAASTKEGDLDAQFETFEEDLKQWHDQWSYLFKQPNIQFVEFTYHYCYVVALYHYKLGNVSLLEMDFEDEDERSEIIDDFEILNKILYHSLKLLNHILKLTEDYPEYFTFVSDQIHLSVFYVSLVFLKIIRWIDMIDEEKTYTYLELNNFVNKVEGIKGQFEKVSKVDNDLVSRYAKGLKEPIEKTREFLTEDEE